MVTSLHNSQNSHHKTQNGMGGLTMFFKRALLCFRGADRQPIASGLEYKLCVVGLFLTIQNPKTGHSNVPTVSEQESSIEGVERRGLDE